MARRLALGGALLAAGLLAACSSTDTTYRTGGALDVSVGTVTTSGDLNVTSNMN